MAELAQLSSFIAGGIVARFYSICTRSVTAGVKCLPMIRSTDSLDVWNHSLACDRVIVVSAIRLEWTES